MNASMISEFSTDTVIQKKVNLNKKFVKANQIQAILNKNEDESIVLFVDGRGFVWELIPREDLTVGSLRYPDNIVSWKFKKRNQNEGLLNIEVKDMNNTSLNTSYLQTTKNDFNISILLKD